MKWAVFNQKGGVGKTSLTCNLASAFAKLGRKVLVVDLDAQCNASRYLLGEAYDKATHTISDFFSSTLAFKIFKNSLQDGIYKSAYDELYVIPASPELKELQTKLEGRYKIFKLNEAIQAACESMGFQDVFYDTPPALNFYSMSALIASDRVLIPFDCDAFSAEAILNVMNVVDEVASDHRPDLDVEGIIINQFQKSARLPQKTIDALLSQGYKVLEPFLSSSIAMRESHSAGIPLPYFKPNHKLALEFTALATKLLRVSKQKAPTKTSGRSVNPRARALEPG